VNTSITRRAMLATLPACLAAQTSRSRLKAKPLPAVGDFVRFADPTTETFVVRLTSLNSSNFLPSASNRFVSVKDRYLLFSSDREGPFAPFQVDLRTGLVRRLATPSRLLSESLCLEPKERWLYFLDGTRLQRVELSNKEGKRQTEETVAEDVSSFSVSDSGVVFVVRDGNLRRVDKGAMPVVASGVVGTEAKTCLAQPLGSGCLFVREISSSERAFEYASAAGSNNAVLLAKGSISDPFWSPDGKSLLFLRDVIAAGVTLAEIHEVGLDGKNEHCVASTSQFASFAPNFDGSVFVGASRSKAQPNVVLLLRSAKREMTLCQHHSSHPAAVSPVFSPDARRVYFQSDEEGKPAIYSVNVELLIEPPGSNSEV
jgi:oligogalacturonide lyase